MPNIFETLQNKAGFISFQQLELASPFQLYFNPILILKQGQLWRLVTTFLFFGTFGFNFFFNMIFTYRHCRMLEEGSFRGRTADFVMMFLFGAVCMIVSFNNLMLFLLQLFIYCIFLNPNQIFAFFVNLLFLGQALTIMIVYIWSRRNPFVRMNFFGLLNFQVTCSTVNNKDSYCTISFNFRHLIYHGFYWDFLYY